ncbi:hypothetical protein GCM10007898_44030 [Dyella flagellata]|uniref:Uncharacterized protein n=1 Tax=Dyella flagellata TaxID=1867833 RepID=A0ABQ5XIQ6_9GAMM|nr:hypothetical protein GCM10007898_44030 [Dyella flagellata]
MDSIGAEPKNSAGITNSWWRQAMMGSAKAHPNCIKAFSETDSSEDLKKIMRPTLVLRGDDDPAVRYKVKVQLSHTR